MRICLFICSTSTSSRGQKRLRVSTFCCLTLPCISMVSQTSEPSSRSRHSHRHKILGGRCVGKLGPATGLGLLARLRFTILHIYTLNQLDPIYNMQERAESHQTNIPAAGPLQDLIFSIAIYIFPKDTIHPNYICSGFPKKWAVSIVMQRWQKWLKKTQCVTPSNSTLTFL